MEENNIMVNEAEVNDEAYEVADENTGMATGVAMAIGSALTLVGIAGFKALKKLYAKHRAKKVYDEAAEQAVNEAEVIDIVQSDDDPK